MTDRQPHISVLRDEAVAALLAGDAARDANAVYLDATFGAGGYARAILEGSHGRVIALDQDPRARAFADDLRARFDARFWFIAGNFSHMLELLAAHGVGALDGVVFDLGVSSMQLDEAARGFSFRQDGPLDMRMAQAGTSAADIVNRASESELADIFYYLGEERQARPIARAIVAARATAPIARTAQLADIVAGIVRGRPGHHPATRAFQALRIAVNDELAVLMQGLVAAEAMLKPGGRLAVVTFHSLEDRLVKDFLGERSGRAPAPSRHAPPAREGRAPSFALDRAGAIKPSAQEEARNPRARSAKLRVATRTNAPAWPAPALASSLDLMRRAA